jgi:L-cysteine desulfidase
MVGSISGMICDGAKDGCAYKLALVSERTIQSALLAIKVIIIDIIDSDLNNYLKI